MSEDKTDRAALEAEATYSDRREFTYNDVVYVVEGDVEEWELDVMKAYEEGKSIALAESLVGPKQWARFMRTKPKNRDFANFTEKMFETIGTDKGE